MTGLLVQTDRLAIPPAVPSMPALDPAGLVVPEPIAIDLQMPQGVTAFALQRAPRAASATPGRSGQGHHALWITS